MYQYLRVYDTFVFITDYQVSYEICFVKTYYFGQFPLISDEIYEIVLSIDANSVLKKAPFDPKSAATISAIFTEFFQEDNKTVLYFCDISDARQAARNRKFNRWFEQFNKGSFLKIDKIFEADDKNSFYFASMILKNVNPLKFEIIHAFDKLTDSLEENK